MVSKKKFEEIVNRPFEKQILEPHQFVVECSCHHNGQPGFLVRVDYYFYAPIQNVFLPEKKRYPDWCFFSKDAVFVTYLSPQKVKSIKDLKKTKSNKRHR